MFRKVSIVCLEERDSLLDFSLEWPAKISQSLSLDGNIALLKYAQVVEGSVAQLLAKDVKGTLLIPIHQKQQALCQWIHDINAKEFEQLTKMIQSVFPDVRECHGKYWYWDKVFEINDLQDHYIIDTSLSIAKELQELEMMLYANSVNQDRKDYQKKEITGFMLGKIGSQGSIGKVVGNSKLMSMLGDQEDIDKWLLKPYSGCSIVLGKEMGDGVWHQIQETLMLMMEKRQLELVEVIQSNRHTIYSASWFYKLYSRYLFKASNIID